MPSSTSHPASREAHDPRREIALWTGVLAGPVLWLTLLEVTYVMSYVSCETRSTWFLHLATFVATALAAAAGLWGWSAGQGANERARWMALVSLTSTIWFILVILSIEIPVIVLRTCQ